MPVDKSSMDRHDQHYSKETVEEVKASHERKTKNKDQYRKDNPIGEVVDNVSDNVKIAVDIGSGHGWGTKYLSNNFDLVYSIEPSKYAMKIAKELYADLNNVVWVNGFAEEELSKLTLEQPALFYTACVLSHLTDLAVEQICSAIDKVAKPGSIFSFSENWNKNLHNHLWHSRTQQWWEKQFPDWDLTFRDTPGQPSGVKKGIIGFKKK